MEIRCRVGYLSGELALHENLTGRELLDYVANLRGLPDRWLAGASAWTSTQAATSMTCPRGNRQKLGLVQALKRHPRAAAPGRADQRAGPAGPAGVPTHRPRGHGRGADGVPVLHVLSEVECMADRVGIIRDGRLVDLLKVGTLKTHALRRFELDFARPVPAAVFERLPGMVEVVVVGSVARGAVEGSVDALIKAAAGHELVNRRSCAPWSSRWC